MESVQAPSRSLKFPYSHSSLSAAPVFLYIKYGPKPGMVALFWGSEVKEFKPELLLDPTPIVSHCGPRIQSTHIHQQFGGGESGWVDGWS